jgi:hypothetical protein
MLKLRDLMIFLAGAEFFHTIMHLLVPLMIKLPLDLKFMVLTPTINITAFIVNAVITVVLLALAVRFSN